MDVDTSDKCAKGANCIQNIYARATHAARQRKDADPLSRGSRDIYEADVAIDTVMGTTE